MNGMLEDLSILKDPPFSDQGSIVEVFPDLSVWSAVRKAIERVNGKKPVCRFTGIPQSSLREWESGRKAISYPCWEKYFKGRA